MDTPMFYALLYLDKTRRIRIYAEGGHHLEENVSDIGWCMCADDAKWDDEIPAMAELAKVAGKIAKGK